MIFLFLIDTSVFYIYSKKRPVRKTLHMQTISQYMSLVSVQSTVIRGREQDRGYAMMQFMG